jgi:ribosome-associated protein
MPLVMKEQTHDTKEKTCYEIAAQAAYDKKGWDIVILDMMMASIMADYFVICSARNTRQAQSIADNVEEELEKNGYTVRHVEGYRSGRWILIDAGDVVTHVFVDQERSYYELENLWCDAPRIPFEGE